MPAPDGAGWADHARRHHAHDQPALDLSTLGAGDRLLVETRNTHYLLEWGLAGAVTLSTNRSDRPFGQVLIDGCAARRLGNVNPGILFCGGRMEYHSMNGQVRHRTSEIRVLKVIRAAGAS